MLCEILPDDVIEDILSRIPAKILVRFRAVSKSWRDLIANPQFIAKHHQTRAAMSNNGCILLQLEPVHPERNGLLCFVYGAGQSQITWEVSLYFKTRKRRSIAFVAPCNGIVCMVFNRLTVVLWNPAIRQVKALPHSHLEYLMPPPNFVIRGEPILGLCFDPKSNVYKVVRIWVFGRVYFGYSTFTREEEFFNIVEVWTPPDQCWRQIDVVPPVPLTPACTMFETLNLKGRCYWRAGSFDRELVFFDMVDEVFGAILLPDANSVETREEGAERPFWPIAAVLNESIALISSPLQRNEKCFEVWLMKESMEGRQVSWSKHITVETPLPDMLPLGFWKNGEVILQDYDGNLVFLNTRSGETINTKLKVNNLKPVCVYDESLVSIKGVKDSPTTCQHNQG